MLLEAVSFFLGTASYSGLFFPWLHVAGGTLLILLCVTGFVWWRYSSVRVVNIICIFMIGTLLTAVYSQWFISRLPHSLADKTVEVRGVVTSIPQQRGNHLRFQFSIDDYRFEDVWYSLGIRAQLNWYHHPLPLQVGERWQLRVRLKRPHGFSNPGGFNYQAWLMRQGITALGSVRNSEGNHRLSVARFRYFVARLRSAIAVKLDQQIQSPHLASLIKALTVGVRDGVNQQQWNTLRATGTSHLMAISGLHIGMVAGFVYWLMSYLWRCVPGLCLRFAATQAAAVAALLAAAVYAALAGFSLPTQRALIMLIVFMGAQLLRRPLAPWHALSVALILVVLFEPLASLAPGFYLSFAAVALILFGMNGRLQMRSLWWRWGRVHWVVSIGLLPLSLWLFQTVSFIGFFANLIAIPWVGWFVVPLCLLAIALLSIAPSISQLLLYLAAQGLQLLLNFLHLCTHFMGMGWQHTLPSAWVFVVAVCGVILLLAPRGWPARWHAILLLLPLILVKPSVPAVGDVWFTLLDVGQGLAAVARTATHVLVFDAGPKYSASFDAGSAIVLPFLRQQGIDHIDVLLLSHGDSDHSGGVPAILQNLTVKKLLTSVPQRFKLPITQSCQRGQHWQWDGVEFNVLGPAKLQNTLSGNNRSCVVMIRAHQQRILLTGDIEKPAEEELLQQLSENSLHADVIVAPHHGSNTSSSLDFIRAVGAKYVLFASGFHNRYHFPAREVVKRYLKLNTKSLNTANVGAISLKLQRDRSLEDEFSRSDFLKR